MPHHHQRIQLAYLKGSWHAGNQHNAFEHLSELTDSIHVDDALLARCHHTLGLWKEEFDDGRMSKVNCSFPSPRTDLIPPSLLFSLESIESR